MGNKTVHLEQGTVAAWPLPDFVAQQSSFFPF